MSENDQVAAIDGLTKEYAPFITNIIARPGSVSVGELEALLIAQEEMIEKYRSRDNNFQANLAQSGHQPKRFNNSQQNSRFGRRRGQSFQGRNGGRSGGRGGRSSNRPMCQVCGKTDHIALDCWHRFDQQFNSLGLSQTQQFHTHQLQTQPNTPRPRAHLSMSNYRTILCPFHFVLCF